MVATNPTIEFMSSYCCFSPPPPPSTIHLLSTSVRHLFIISFSGFLIPEAKYISVFLDSGLCCLYTAGVEMTNPVFKPFRLMYVCLVVSSGLELCMFSTFI